MQQTKDNTADQEQEFKLGNIPSQTEVQPAFNCPLCPLESLSGCLLGEVTSASYTQFKTLKQWTSYQNDLPKMISGSP